MLCSHQARGVVVCYLVAYAGPDGGEKVASQLWCYASAMPRPVLSALESELEDYDMGRYCPAYFLRDPLAHFVMQCRKLTFCLALSETDVEAVVGRWTAVARMIKAISEVTDGPSKSQGLGMGVFAWFAVRPGGEDGKVGTAKGGAVEFREGGFRTEQ
eukprot:91572-Rhodomonas_salina.2